MDRLFCLGLLGGLLGVEAEAFGPPPLPGGAHRDSPLGVSPHPTRKNPIGGVAIKKERLTSWCVETRCFGYTRFFLFFPPGFFLLFPPWLYLELARVLSSGKPVAGINDEIPNGPSLIVEKKLVNAPNLAIGGPNLTALQIVYTS